MPAARPPQVGRVRASPRFVWAAALLAAALACCFADAWCGRAVGFRDSVDFHPPLARLVARQWLAARAPLWNRYQGAGTPLAAGGTAAAFYPPSLVYVVLDEPQATNVYLLGHAALALCGAYRLARRWGADVAGATLAAASYGLGGTVLFQCANPPMLAGAAWMPLAWEAADRLVRGRRLRAAIALAAVLAMMVLAGDPQAAYHAALVAAALGLYAWRRPLDAEAEYAAGLLRHRGLLLATAVAAAFALSAVQLLPTVELARQSDRGGSGLLARLSGDGRAALTDDFFARTEPGTHPRRVYHYSVGPWRLAELVWPNIAGRAFPEHRRWLDAWRAEGGWWTPSLYQGLLPLVLAIVAVWPGRTRDGTAGVTLGRPERSEHHQVAPVRLLALVVVLATVASFGWYGIGWMAEATAAAVGSAGAVESRVGAPFGGLYWLLTWIAPGYAQFRYPGKLSSVAALAIAMLAAEGFRLIGQWRAGDEGRRDRRSAAVRATDRAVTLLAAAACLGVALLAAAVVSIKAWGPWLSAAGPHPLFGPLDVRGAAADVVGSLSVTVAVVALATWLLRRTLDRPRAAAGLALLVVAELVWNNGWLVASRQADAVQTPAALAAMQRDRGLWQSHRGLRVYRPWDWLPGAFAEYRSPDRVAEIARWQQSRLAPNHHLDLGVGQTDALETLPPAEYAALFDGASSADRRRWLDLLGAEYFVLPAGESPPDAEAIHTGDDLRVWKNRRAMPRTWIVHRVATLPPLDGARPAALAEQARKILRDDGRPRDFSLEAVVESVDAAPSPVELRPATAGGESCRLARDDPGRVEIIARLAAPGLVVLADQFYPGWQVSVESDGQAQRPHPILRTNRIFRGVWLPAGSHRLIFAYAPGSFLIGARVSIVAWLAAIATLGLGQFSAARQVAARKRRPRPS